MSRVHTPKITPFLWFDQNAEEAARFYTSLFKNSRILEVTPMMVTFELEGQRLMALNGGPEYKFSEAISLYVSCDSQTEVDYYWEGLTARGGQEVQCGWLRDPYGLSWQIIPTALGRLMSSPDPAQNDRVLQAMLKMKKLDIPTLEQAARG